MLPLDGVTPVTDLLSHDLLGTLGAMTDEHPDWPSFRELFPDGAPSLVELLDAGRRLVDYATVHRVYELLDALKWTTKDFDFDADRVLYAKYEDRPLTHTEVWNKAIDEALLELDAELGRLWGRQY